MGPSNYIDCVRTLPRDAFVANHPGHFLLKRPKPDAKVEPPCGFGFATVAAEIDFDPLASEWLVLPVIKRPSSPFPGRITVGRATNCDIVLRVPTVSKVHAHILYEESGVFGLQNNRPSNATLLNNERLAPGESRPLQIGDSIRLGTLEFEFVDAIRLYDIVKSEAG